MAELVQAIFQERPYEKDDLQAVVAIEKAAGEASWSKAEIAFNARQLIRETRVITTGIEEVGEKVIAFFVVEFEENELYLCNLAVASEWRRKGVASFALHTIEEMARQLNYSQISLDVQENNLAAQLLYKKAHYTAVEIRPGHYGTQDGYHMVLKLNH